VLWLFYGGSYGIHIDVQGNRGAGTVILPLNAAALRQPSISPSLATLLVSLGILLFVGLIWFVGVAARESTLKPGAVPGRRDLVRSRLVAAVSAFVFAGAIYAGRMRWQKMDREFRANALYQP